MTTAQGGSAQIATLRGGRRGDAERVLSKTQAEVALDLVSSIWNSRARMNAAGYRDADAYFGLYERAYRLIWKRTRKAKNPPPVQA